MGTSRLLIVIKWMATVVAGLTALYLPFLGYVEYAGIGSNPLVKWFYARKAHIIFSLLATQTICQLTQWILGFIRRPDRKKIHQALNAIVGRQFAGVDPDRYESRATLFKRRSFPGLGCWLGMVARSGEKYRRMRTIFSIHHSDHGRNTGVAGECYWRGKTVILEVEPVEDEDVEGDTPRDCKDYTKRTFLADEEFSSLTMKSCVFFVTCIKIDGKKWGVLVLDSTDPNSGPPKTQKKARMEDLEHTAELLSMLLK